MLRLLLFNLLLLISAFVNAQIEVAKIFTDNMVLQRNKNIVVWGTGIPNQKVHVDFKGSKQKCIVDVDGNWKVTFKPFNASSVPSRMTIRCNKDKIDINNILIGEVWLASGQSNMEYTIGRPQKSSGQRYGKNIQEIEFSKASAPLMRVLYVKKELNSKSLPTDGWQEVVKGKMNKMSAVGYFFAKSLIDSLNIPVGIISSSWGGSQIERWIPKEFFFRNQSFASDIQNHSLTPDNIGDMYDSMIKRLIPYSFRGIIWYQGESNLINNSDYIASYYDKQKLLINSYRELWDDTSLPFYYVQIAPYRYSKGRDSYPCNWMDLAKFWEVQTKCLDIPNTGMVVTTDIVDDLNDIHPSYKWIVGERLAKWALCKQYGFKNIVPSGPIFKEMKREGNKMRIFYKYADHGLKSSDGKPLNDFYISGNGIKFQKAEAVIEGNSILVSSSRVGNPVAVRFAWDEESQPNLFNNDGLPAVSFSSHL